jgi:membrane carboxypeptidase/penicillin-binding protein PbpC
MSVVRTASDPSALRIVSPRDGDRYRVPPGVPSRYATLPLRANAATPVRWYVDGSEVHGARWVLRPGSHRVEARTAGARDSVRIDVLD